MARVTGGFLEMMSSHCGRQSLNLVSLTFGLSASGGLALAVVTDFWLFTSETIPIPHPPVDPDPERLGGVHVNSSFIVEYDAHAQYGRMSGLHEEPTYLVHIHSGLWRICIKYGMMTNEGLYAVDVYAYRCNIVPMLHCQAHANHYGS